MGTCRKCGYQSDKIKSQYCAKCWDEKIKEDARKYGTKTCPICKHTKITANWPCCPACKKKYNK